MKAAILLVLSVGAAAGVVLGHRLIREHTTALIAVVYGVVVPALRP